MWTYALAVTTLMSSKNRLPQDEQEFGTWLTPPAMTMRSDKGLGSKTERAFETSFGTGVPVTMRKVVWECFIMKHSNARSKLSSCGVVPPSLVLARLVSTILSVYSEYCCTVPHMTIVLVNEYCCTVPHNGEV